jgi:hypothetical protein
VTDCRTEDFYCFETVEASTSLGGQLIPHPARSARHLSSGRGPQSSRETALPLWERGDREAVGGAPESALGRRGESPLQVNVTCNRLQLRRRETGWEAAGGERLVRRLTNSIRPARRGESAT